MYQMLFSRPEHAVSLATAANPFLFDQKQVPVIIRRSFNEEGGLSQFSLY